MRRAYAARHCSRQRPAVTPRAARDLSASAPAACTNQGRMPLACSVQRERLPSIRLDPGALLRAMASHRPARAVGRMDIDIVRRRVLPDCFNQILVGARAAA